MPKHCRNRSSRVFRMMWAISILAVGVFATGLGSAPVRAENHEPPPEESIAPTETPDPEIQCPGGAGSEGPLPAGSQSIGGLVTDGSSTPLADIRVRITSTSGGGTSTTTGADGRYVMDSLGDASYLVSFFDPTATYQSGFYDAGPLALSPAAATPVDLTGSGADAGAVLPAETFGSIAGTVVDNNGLPVDGALVWVEGAYFPISGYCDVTDASGAYLISGLRTAAYRVGVSASGHPSGYYESTTGFTGGFAGTTLVEVTGVAVSGINFRFPPVFTLTGVVLDGAGNPVDGMSLSACETTIFFCGSGESGGGTGEFTITGLVAGSYRLQASHQASAYLSGYYAGDGLFSAMESGAVEVAVPGDPIQLLAVPAPYISGTITNALNAPVESVFVSVCDVDEFNCFGAATDALGEYLAYVPVPGTYLARLFDGNGIYPSGGLIGSGGSVALDTASALEIVVGSDNVTGVNATLPDGGRIGLTLTSGGNPVPYASVEFCRSEFICPDGAGTDDVGAALSPPMFVGTYYVKAHDAEYTSEYWHVDGAVASGSFADATAVVVAANVTETLVVDLPSSEPPTPDANGDGIIDTLQPSGTPDGSFVDGATTYGSIVANAGLAVSITDEPDPAGVLIAVSPEPAGAQAELLLCGFTVLLDAGTTTTQTCGSVTLGVSLGTAFILLGGGTVVSIPEGGAATVDTNVDGSFSVVNIGEEGSPSVSLTVDGTAVPIVPGETTTAATWDFVGFFQPVDNAPTLNKVKVKQAITFKWRLLDSSGAPVLDLAGATVSATSLDCTSGASVDPIEQFATTTSGLKNLGDGYYQLNWKAPSSYANSCRVLHLDINDGVLHDALFWFTK